MNVMAEKAQSDTGNHFCVLCNAKLWQDMQLVLHKYLSDAKTDGTYMYSKAANKGGGGYIKVGNTFSTYEFAGKKIAA